MLSYLNRTSSASIVEHRVFRTTRAAGSRRQQWAVASGIVNAAPRAVCPPGAPTSRSNKYYETFRIDKAASNLELIQDLTEDRASLLVIAQVGWFRAKYNLHPEVT